MKVITIESLNVKSCLWIFKRSEVTQRPIITCLKRLIMFHASGCKLTSWRAGKEELIVLPICFPPSMYKISQVKGEWQRQFQLPSEVQRSDRIKDWMMDDINISFVFYIPILSPKTQNTGLKIHLFLTSTLSPLHEKGAQTRLVEGTLILPYSFHFSLQIQQYLNL